MDIEGRDSTGTDLIEERLVPDLLREFEGRRSAGEVRACARAVLARYDGAPVRSFILPLAHRRRLLFERSTHQHSSG